MNQQQKNYLRRRIDEIMAQHLDTIKNETADYEAPTLGILMEQGFISWKRADDINAMLKEEEFREYTSFNIKDLFNGVEKARAKVDKDRAQHSLSVSRRLDAVKQRATALKDSVVFGSDKFALEMIEEFANTKF